MWLTGASLASMVKPVVELLFAPVAERPRLALYLSLHAQNHWMLHIILFHF
jgi:hypothetical protein